MSIQFILLLLSAVSFTIAAAGVPQSVQLVALGLLFWVLTILIGHHG